MTKHSRSVFYFWGLELGGTFPFTAVTKCQQNVSFMMCVYGVRNLHVLYKMNNIHNTKAKMFSKYKKCILLAWYPISGNLFIPANLFLITNKKV